VFVIADDTTVDVAEYVLGTDKDVQGVDGDVTEANGNVGS